MRKKWLALGCLLIIVLLGIWAYNVWFGTTKIAFVNFQTITMGGIAKANDNSFIKLQEVPVEELDRLSGFDMVFVNGMGLRVVEEQRQQIQKAADKGVLVYTTMATNPANNICTIDSVDQVALRGYLGSGGRRNYKNMLNYIRKNMDKKLISVEEPGVPIERSSDVLYHVDVDKSGDELDFVSVEEYEKYLKSKQLYKEGAKKIVVTGQMADATGLIDTLERVGYNVYPVLSLRRLLDFVREISPDAIINMAHGRLGDEVVKYLEERNILLFAPLTVNSLVKEWEQDPMGMSGGFMSQSIVTPEIDGAIRTSALFAQYEDKEGLRHSFAVPSRLKTYVENIQKTLALKEKPNSEKRVVIYYYKGPGQSAMNAAGMEVVPSLYNLLKKMKEEGYRVENLPANSKELEKMIMAEGAVFGTYANGVMDRFLKEGHPLLISKEEYESWVKQALRPEKYAEVVAAFGEFPGEYMSPADGILGISRIQFGNVVIMPQPAAGGGAVPFCCIFILQDAPADGLRHSQQLFLPDEAELHLVLVGVADRQFRSLQWVAEACRLDAEVDDLPVGQDEDLLPGAGNALHIHNENAVARKNGLIAHRLVCAHDAFAVQQKRLHILADLLLLDADEVLHRLFPKFHTGVSLLLPYIIGVSGPSITFLPQSFKSFSPFGPGCVILTGDLRFLVYKKEVHIWRSSYIRPFSTFWIPRWMPPCSAAAAWR